MVGQQVVLCRAWRHHTSISHVAEVEQQKYVHLGSSQQQALDSIKKILCEAPVLAAPDPQQTFILDTDTLMRALGL